MGDSAEIDLEPANGFGNDGDEVMHAGTMWLSESGLALSRVTPPPAL